MGDVGDTKPAKKLGRPAKGVGKRQNYTFRMNEDVRAVIAASAEAGGRSMSEEIERRVAQSFELERRIEVLEEAENRLWKNDDERGLSEMFSLILHSAERSSGGSWRETIAVPARVSRAIFVAMRRMSRTPSLGILDQLLSPTTDVIGDEIGKLVAETCAHLFSPLPDPPRMERVVVLFKDKASGNVLETVDGGEVDVNRLSEWQWPPALEAAMSKYASQRETVETAIIRGVAADVTALARFGPVEVENDVAPASAKKRRPKQ